VKTILIAAVAVLALGAGTSATAAGFINGGFEDGPALNFGSYARGNGAPTGWSAVPGYEAPDILSNAYNQTGAGFEQLLHAHSGDRYLDMNGQSASGGLYQDVSGITLGSTVVITYWVSQWAQNSAGTLTASLGGTDALDQVTTVAFNNTATSAAWTQYTLVGTATASTVRVQFLGLAPSCCSIGAPGLDDVSFTVIGGTAVVPEPATWALMIGGFGLAGASLRRRRAAAQDQRIPGGKTSGYSSLPVS
jgi:hypothetical protein